MAVEFDRAVAFIFEGDTEKIFYINMLKYFASQHFNATLEKVEDDGETFYVARDEENSVLIKVNRVGTISQVTNSGAWFLNRCQHQYKGLNWTVFLCYDTDKYQEDVSKFYEGDWLCLRKQLEQSGKNIVIDLAAKADIEDIMLLDSDGVFAYLGIAPCEIPTGGKGKSKMKKIFRMKGEGSAYHEGNRAKPLIEALNIKKIIDNSSIPFSKIDEVIFK